jgi:hypothetical protein
MRRNAMMKAWAIDVDNAQTWNKIKSMEKQRDYGIVSSWFDMVGNMYASGEK